MVDLDTMLLVAVLGAQGLKIAIDALKGRNPGDLQALVQKHNQLSSEIRIRRAILASAVDNGAK